MIMAGCEFMGDIPFKNVYIHGTVRDITGTKMSKSLGNVIDPLDMIKKYGTDALRFSIISITAQGQDVFLSESKFELGRNFANKLWNVSRFLLMNLKPEDVDVGLCTFFNEQDLTLPDKWVLSRFYSTLLYVEKCLDEFKFNEAANAIYEFVWGEFCDWYVEIAKLSIGEKKTQVILYKILEKCLRMLHPFMPFITEEIWQKLPHEKDHPSASIMTQPWPRIQKDMIDAEAEAEMALLIEIISSIRNIRSVWNIEQTREVAVIFNTVSKTLEEMLSRNSLFIKRLAKVGDIKAGKVAKPKGSAVSIVKDMEICVPLEGLIDFDKEKTRLKKEEAKLNQIIESMDKRLNDQSFVSKAPKDLVEKQRAQRADLEIQLKKIRENIASIG